MNMPLETSPTPAWLERFRVDPRAALDDMLRGLARVPPYERAAPPDVLNRLFWALPADAPDRRLLDETLRDWLAARCVDINPERHTEYGLPRFVTETMDALSTVWLLDLPRSGAWIQDNFLELTRRAAPLCLPPVWDLPRALAQTAALTQTDQRLLFHWMRLCEDAARPLPAGPDRPGPEWPEQPAGHPGAGRQPRTHRGAGPLRRRVGGDPPESTGLSASLAGAQGPLSTHRQNLAQAVAGGVDQPPVPGQALYRLAERGGTGVGRIRSRSRSRRIFQKS